MVNDMSAVRPQDLDNRDRESLFKRAENEHFDVLVIGGGITGTGVARSAASRGLSVALIEAQDLASGTDPAKPVDCPDQVSSAAARNLPTTRAGGQDDGNP